MRPLRTLGFLGALGVVAALVACNPTSQRCEAVCTKFVLGCGWNAWTSVEQCRQGCVEDMYRRDDANEVLDCYVAASDAPAEETAASWVDRAYGAGVFDAKVAAGTYSREEAVEEAIAFGTCDVFAAVQCKVDAVIRPPRGLFIAP